MAITIDIWSDVMCPFCYIGKRHLEAALEQFGGREEVSIIWHSYQLDPGALPQPGKDIISHLAERKGQSREWSEGLHRQVTEMAAAAGLDFHFEQVVIANSFDAHRLIQMAKQHGLADAMEERLFRAYFSEGKDICSRDTLVRLGGEAGLDEAATREMLEGIGFSIEVRADIAAAGQLGVQGVPFFVVNERYGISGAQPEKLFLQVLEKAAAEGA